MTRRISMIEKIKDNAWAAFDKLRTSGLSPGQFLELLCLVVFVSHNNRDLLDKLLEKDKAALLKEISNLEQDRQVKDLVDKNLFEQLTMSDLNEMYLIVKNVASIDDLNFVTDLFKTMNSNLGHRATGPDSFQLSSNLAINILQPEARHKIYDPYFGGGTNFEAVLTQNPQQEIYGQTFEHTWYVIAQVLAYLRNANNVSIRNEDALNVALPADVVQQMDLVVSCPPFNSRREIDLSDPRRYQFGQPSRTNDWAFIMSGLYALNPNGRAAFVTTNSPIYRGGKDAEVRKKIIAQDMVEAVIILPDEPHAPTSVPLVLLIFNMNKKFHQGRLVFINGRHLVQNKKTTSLELSEQIRKIIHDGAKIEGISTLATNEEIEQNNGVLVPDQYIIQNVFKINEDLTIQVKRSKWDSADKYVLGEVAEIYRGFNITSKDENVAGKYSLLKISDLSGNGVNFKNLAKTDGKTNTKVANYQIKKGDVLLPIRGEIKHIGVVKEEHPDVLLTQNIIGIRPNNDMINSEWLAEYLNSPLGRARLSGISVGTRIRQIPLKMLKKMEIIKLPKNVQDAAISKFEQEMEDLHEELVKIKRAMNKQQDSLYDDIKINTLYQKV